MVGRLAVAVVVVVVVVVVVGLVSCCSFERAGWCGEVAAGEVEVHFWWTTAVLGTWLEDRQGIGLKTKGLGLCIDQSYFVWATAGYLYYERAVKKVRPRLSTRSSTFPLCVAPPRPTLDTRPTKTSTDSLYCHHPPFTPIVLKSSMLHPVTLVMPFPTFRMLLTATIPR
jgi:hypothetical protein